MGIILAYILVLDDVPSMRPSTAFMYATLVTAGTTSQCIDTRVTSVMAVEMRLLVVVAVVACGSIDCIIVMLHHHHHNHCCCYYYYCYFYFNYYYFYFYLYYYHHHHFMHPLPS